MSILRIGIGVGCTVYGAYRYHQDRKKEALIAITFGVFVLGLELDNLDRLKQFRAEFLPKPVRLSDIVYDYFFNQQ